MSFLQNWIVNLGWLKGIDSANIFDQLCIAHLIEESWPMSHREYDVVLYGASGFVGRQTVKYFAEHPNSKEVRWAIAGRNRQKLETVKAQVGM
jgi:hypothetical protein